MEHSFEQGLQRLEEILEQLHSGQLSLERSIGLYEEADGLITRCQKQLQAAETKIEMIIKNREGEALFNEQQQPLTETFSS